MSAPEPVAVPRPVGRARLLAAAAAIVFAGVAAYLNTFRVPFVFDDPPAITGNPGLRHLWPPWSAFDPSAPASAVTGRPVANLTLALNYAISGYDPWSYHALNLLIHLLAGLALFGIVRRTLLRLGIADRGLGIGGAGPAEATLLGFAVALLWTVHPLQTEAVTYTVQRVESLMGLFFFLTFYCFIRAVDADGGSVGIIQKPGSQGGSPFAPWRLGGSRKWSALAVIACLLGMATKEVMSVAPVLVFLYDRTFVAGTFRDAWRRRRGFYLLLAATWLPLLALVAGTGWNRVGTAGFNVGIAPWAYWLTQFEALPRYLALVLWPHPLVFEYGTFWVHRAAAVLPGALVVVALLAATLVALWKTPAAGFLGAWFFAILAPTSVIPGTMQMIVEHRMYLPLAAVLTALVLGLHSLLRRPALTLAFTLTLTFVLGLLTFRRNADYRSELVLWGDTVAKRPDNARALKGLGVALDHAGRAAEAIPVDEHALAQDPGDIELVDNLGVALEHAGRNAEAIRRYEEALRMKPDYPEAHANLGNALLRDNRVPEAIAEYETAVRLRPDFAEFHYNLAGALDRAGRTAAAVAEYETALRLKPDYFEGHVNYGNLLLREGDPAAASAHYEAALRLRPAAGMPHYDLGLALEQQGRPDAAIAEYEAALRLQPDLPEAQNNLGTALARADRLPEAVAHLRAAVRLRPGFAKAHFNLGNALIASGQWDAAIAEYEAALRLQPDYPAARANLERARAERPGGGGRLVAP